LQPVASFQHAPALSGLRLSARRFAPFSTHRAS
jgi:hypothetical protein